jgi:hypothetical protein
LSLRDDQQAQQATECQDPEAMAQQILEALPQVIAMLPPTEVRAVLQRVEGLV